MSRYAAGCPGVAWWLYALALLGGVCLLFLATLAYQWAFETLEARKG